MGLRQQLSPAGQREKNQKSEPWDWCESAEEPKAFQSGKVSSAAAIYAWHTERTLISWAGGLFTMTMWRMAKGVLSVHWDVLPH